MIVEFIEPAATEEVLAHFSTFSDVGGQASPLASSVVPSNTIFMGWDIPIVLAAALVAGVFALVNSIMSENLKRLWLRGDRMRLLRAEYLHLEHHYSETLRIWRAPNLRFDQTRLREAKYRDDGFLSQDAAGLASLYPEALRNALHLMGFVRNTNEQIEAAAASLPTGQVLTIQCASNLRTRIERTMNRARNVRRKLPPDWMSISLWRLGALLSHALRPLLRRIANMAAGRTGTS